MPADQSDFYHDHPISKRHQIMVDRTDLFYFLVVTGGWGFSTFIMGFIGKRMTFETALVYTFVGFALVSLATANRVQHGLSIFHFWAVLNGISQAVADLFYYKLSDRGMSVSTLGPLTSTFVIVPTVLGILLLKESVSKKKILGLVLGIAAAYLLAAAEHEVQEVSSTPDGAITVPSLDALAEVPDT
eukprot:TRINITY_DN9935_c0_g1_i1.p1 TRINITY_DN9935_c0_g1~~TRINITY_DN9935_c0_g1_i1.p1  ORF type:complete len:187 (+),score=16.11 TRINITY_DN9935_c0_g1_i1:119-679(+)